MARVHDEAFGRFRAGPVASLQLFLSGFVIDHGSFPRAAKDYSGLLLVVLPEGVGGEKLNVRAVEKIVEGARSLRCLAQQVDGFTASRHSGVFVIGAGLAVAALRRTATTATAPALLWLLRESVQRRKREQRDKS